MMYYTASMFIVKLFSCKFSPYIVLVSSHHIIIVTVTVYDNVCQFVMLPKETLFGLNGDAN